MSVFYALWCSCSVCDRSVCLWTTWSQFVLLNRIVQLTNTDSTLTCIYVYDHNILSIREKTKCGMGCTPFRNQRSSVAKVYSSFKLAIFMLLRCNPTTKRWLVTTSKRTKQQQQQEKSIHSWRNLGCILLLMLPRCWSPPAKWLFSDERG